MKVAKDHIVGIEYQLTLGDGTLVDKSEPGEPLEYLQGHGQIVPGLERELEGLSQGDSKKVVVKPSEGYGDHDPDGVKTLPRAMFPADIESRVGEHLAARSPDGHAVEFEVKAVAADTVTVDMNHPLAGQTLHFDITIAHVREAAPEELAHGHAHGPSGHH